MDTTKARWIHVFLLFKPKFLPSRPNIAAEFQTHQTEQHFSNLFLGSLHELQPHFPVLLLIGVAPGDKRMFLCVTEAQSSLDHPPPTTVAHWIFLSLHIRDSCVSSLWTTQTDNHVMFKVRITYSSHYSSP